MRASAGGGKALRQFGTKQALFQHSTLQLLVMGMARALLGAQPLLELAHPAQLTRSRSVSAHARRMCSHCMRDGALVKCGLYSPDVSPTPALNHAGTALVGSLYPRQCRW